MSTEHVLKQFSLTDQVAIVTGGGQGLGREMALALSEVHRRSEERRVGKECRSRWSPYH